MASPNSPCAYSPRAIRIYIVRRTGAPQGEHAFLGHPWCQNDSNQGIALGVLEWLSLKNLLGLIKAQRAAEVIDYPLYLIGATREGSNALSVDPRAPLPLQDLIFLNKDNELGAWLLANDSKHPLDLIVLESRHEQAGDHRSTPEPVRDKHPFLHRNVWDHSGQAEDIVGGTQWDDEDGEDAHIVVRYRHMRQQSGECGNEREDMDDHEDDEGEDCGQDHGEEEMLESEPESEMPQERQRIVIDLSVLCFSYLEEYQTQ